jgi:hypothetical protein
MTFVVFCHSFVPFVVFYKVKYNVLMFHLQRKWQAHYGTHGGYYCIIGSLLSRGKLCEKNSYVRVKEEFTRRRNGTEGEEVI